MRKPTTTTYRAKSGQRQYKPSIEFCMAMSHEGQGFCLACGTVNDNIEPDARRYVCEYCNAPKVYGAEELALLGLTF